MSSTEMFIQNLYLERVGRAKECRFIQFRKSTSVIGRSGQADYVFDTSKASTVSREHSLVEFKNNRMYITNLSKTNPTFLNDDKVIRQTEVEEGDLIGFGSKPNVVYPHFSEEQIFIYECKSLSKSKQQNVIIVDDSDDEDVVEIIDDVEDENEIVIENTPSNIIDMKDENSNPESNISELEEDIAENPSKIKLTVEHSKVTLSDIPLHIDTVESINDLSSHSDTEESLKDDDEDVSDHSIQAKEMLNVKIVLEKLTESEMEKWKSKIEKHSLESSEYEYEDVADQQQNDPEEDQKSEKKALPERRISDKDKFFYNGQNYSKSKHEYLVKSLEMREKIRSIVDEDSDDESTVTKKINEIKTSEPVKKTELQRSDSVKSSSSFKRRMSTNEKDSLLFNKKAKLEEPATTTTTNKKMYKFPGATTSNSISIDKQKIKDELKRRSSMSGMKNDTDSSDSMHKASNANKMFKRRMSHCPTTYPKIIPPHSNVKRKKTPPRRQTITEIDMFNKKSGDVFSEMSKLRFKKYGPTGKPSDVKPQKEAVKKSETVINATKKPQICDDVCVDKDKVNQDAKKILDPILNRPVPRVIPYHQNKPVHPQNNEHKQEKSTQELDDIKKAALVKTKFTVITRGECLTEAIPLPRTKPTARRLSSINDPQPSTSKEVMSVTSFYDKYVKPNYVPNVEKTVSVDPIPEDVNAKINIEMKKQHEQLAIETTLTINEQESPIESNSDDEELNLDTDEDDETLGFYTAIDPNTPQNEIPPPFIDPDLGSPMKDDPRGKTKWVASQNDEEPVERTYELQKFPSTPFLTTTIHVHHEKPVEDLKKILKITPVYTSTSMQNKKCVSFNDASLVNVVLYGIDDLPVNIFKQQIAHVPPMRSSIRNPKYFESVACAELLEWDWKWLTLTNELPEGWKVEPHKHTYKSLQEYKKELKTVMNVELLKKLSSKYKTIKEKTWNFMTVKERKDDQNNHIKLVLGSDSKDMKQGTMLLLKVRDTNSVTRKPIDITFFGYVTAVNDRGDLKLDTYCKELRKEKAVLKSTCLLHLRTDIKLLAVLNCIQDTPFMKLFLNPSLNKMDKNEGMTSVSLEFKMTSMKLSPEQRTIIKKISYEYTKEDKEKIMFINGGAGTGKTYMMLAAVLNLKFCLKDKRRYLICTSTISGIDEIAETLYNMPHSSALNIVRIGYRDQTVGRGRKLGLNEQVQQRLNNGTKGKGFKEIQKEIIENSDIILATLKSCYDLFDYQLTFDTCFIDEANFAIDAELMILVQLNIKKMIFVGDEYQLEPTQSLVYKETRSNNSYFNRIIDYYKSNNVNAPVFTLSTQHRMNRDLFYICNKHVYNDSMKYNSVNSMYTANFPFKPFSVFTLDINDNKFIGDEVNLFCTKLCEILPKNVSIGIVNGFPSQRDRSRAKLDTNDGRIECFAVETMQGTEKDVIILTLRNTETYFMHNFNRINVAMTRARKAVYVCSNMNMILYPNEAGLFLRLKDDARNRDLYHIIQKFDIDRLYSMLRK